MMEVPGAEGEGNDDIRYLQNSSAGMKFCGDAHL